MGRRNKSKKKNNKNKNPKNTTIQKQQCTAQQNFKLILEFQGPLMSQASGVMALGLDASMQRDNNNQPVINGSVIRGNIRHALQYFQKELQDEDLKTDIQRWFGQESKANYAPLRATVNFDLFWKVTESDLASTKTQRTRIAIDDNGIVKDGALQVIEDCFPVGNSNPSFEGELVLRYNPNNVQETENFKQWIKKACGYIPAIGSFKGIGYGKLLKATISPINQPPSAVPPQLHNSRFGAELTLNQAFCLGRPITPDSNQIASQEVITGNVIKGLIAQSYNYDKNKLEEDLCFDQLIISHAFPANKIKPSRREPYDLSIAIVESGIENKEGKLSVKKEIKEFSRLSKQSLSEWSESSFYEIAPKFSHDWKSKDHDIVNKHYGNEAVNLKRITLLKTEIAEQGISKENKLFSIECIDPNDEHVWCADIDVSNIDKEKQKTVKKNLRELFAREELTGIGKTKARAKVTLKKEPFSRKELVKSTTNIYVVKLISAARMLPNNLQLQGTNSQQELNNYYEKYWKNYLNNNLELQTYFATQNMTSAYYHSKRQGNSKDYYPEWLTKEGSVFVLKASTKDAEESLQKYLIAGLPAHNEVGKDEVVANWETTPYIPENGYGEITIKPQNPDNGETHD